MRKKVASIQTKMPAFKSIETWNQFCVFCVCFFVEKMFRYASIPHDIINVFFLSRTEEQGNQIHRGAYNCTYISIDELANCLKIKCENESIQLNEIPESAWRDMHKHIHNMCNCLLCMFFVSIEPTIINSDLAYVFHIHHSNPAHL